MKQQVIVLGASGILGRAVFEELKRHTDELDVLGTANARVTADLHQLNAMDDDEVIAFLDQHLSSSSSSPPPIVINCVAERRPDICDSHPDQTRRLNVEFVAHLAKEVTKRQAGKSSTSTRVCVCVCVCRKRLRLGYFFKVPPVLRYQCCWR